MNKIGFIEDFSLSDDRGAVLEKLIQGTEDYYYYHCLHFLNTGDLTKAGDMLEQWIKEFGRTDRAERIEHRKALLEYPEKKYETISYIRNKNGIYSNHEKDVQNVPSHLPEQLDQAIISRKSFEEQALNHHGSSSYIDGYADHCIPDMIKAEKDMDLLRRILERLQRPDVDDLAKYIVKELKDDYTSGFGSLDIHSKLTLEQLDECAKLKSDLLNETAFVHVYLTRLKPGADINLKQDPEAKEAYLQRMWAFVSRLDPVHISLKTQVLYHMLNNEREAGSYDKKLFLQYLTLPKQASYINHEYLALDKHDGYFADLAESCDGVAYGSIDNDEPLVRDFFDHIFPEEKDYKKYLPFVDDQYLKERFATAKLLNGIGDMKQWYAMLSPDKVEALKKRIDLDFLPVNKKIFLPEDEVEFELRMKNIDNLIIKVYEINTDNYYRDGKESITTDIDLDGLVANEERTETYAEDPLHLITRKFSFPALDNVEGVFVVEFIGNGRSSRALIRKGDLRFHEQVTTAGTLYSRSCQAVFLFFLRLKLDIC